MRFQPLLSLALLQTLAAVGAAQTHAIVWIGSNGEVTRSGGNGNLAVGTLTVSDLAFVAPLPGVPYTAGPFLNQGAAYAFLGDADTNGDFVRTPTTGPWGTLDEAFVKRVNGFAHVGPHEIYHSFATTTSPANTTSQQLFDSDIVRFPTNFGVELFLAESQVRLAVGGADIDIDALCQDFAGNLYMSFSDTAIVNGVSQLDGALFYIPATAITYDVNGNVTAITAGSAQLVATEPQMLAMVTASGARDATGAPMTALSTTMEVSGLELDFNGGTFTAPSDGTLVLPNLIFGIDAALADYVIISTAGGGSIAVINGVPMGSTVATTGAHMGVLPSTVGGSGIMGLALIDYEPQPFLVKNSTNAFGPFWLSSEVAGATPGAPLVYFIALPDLVNRFSIVQVPGFAGEVFGAGGPLFVMGNRVADADGYAGLQFFPPPSAIGFGTVVWQVLDLAALEFAVPAVFEF